MPSLSPIVGVEGKETTAFVKQLMRCHQVGELVYGVVSTLHTP